MIIDKIKYSLNKSQVNNQDRKEITSVPMLCFSWLLEHIFEGCMARWRDTGLDGELQGWVGRWMSK